MREAQAGFSAIEHFASRANAFTGLHWGPRPCNEAPVMRIRSLFTCMLALPATAAAAARDDAADTRELLRVEAELCQAFERGDAAIARRDLDATFTLTDSHGGVTGYDRNVADIARREPRYEVFSNHEQKVRLYGDAAIITGVTTVKGTSGKDAFAADFQYTDTWVRRDGRWKLAASHASRLQQ
jgi:ketosteroid isomerase-like protein